MTEASSPSTGTATALAVVGVSKSFAGVTAIDDVSFELKRGEFLTMLGPSGSGKTTTLRIIAGFEAPDGGEVRLSGRDVVRVPAYERNIGMVFQDYALFPHMSVLDNIGFPLEARRVAPRERRRQAAEMLGVVGLGGFEDRLPRQLSGGQQQRVALARALVFNPEIVLLDEPLGALDKKLRGAMQLEILRIVKRLGATVISVTHDQEEALVMSDRIALFSKGKLVQIGTPKQLYETPSTEFVADFIGEANLLRGRYSASNGQVTGTRWIAEMPAGRAPNLVDGEEVTLAIRPENMAVRLVSHDKSDGMSSDQKPNTVIGSIRDAIYLGVEFRLVISLADETLVQARCRDLKALESMKPGESVELSWDKAQVVFMTS